jgi:hypothetical protein
MIRIWQERSHDGLTTNDSLDVTPADFVKMVKSLTQNDGEMRVALGLADAEEKNFVKTNGLGR